jgi:adenosylcobinamide-GDP ribazoletransferase
MLALRHFLLALQFFTRVPVTGKLADWVGYSPAMLRASAAYFPLVGVLVGLVAAVGAALVFIAFPLTAFTPLVAAVAATVVTVWVTGGFHEDGLADVADGLGGSYERERALEIMKDSRVGAFGAMALCLALLLKVSVLALIGSVQWPLMCGALLAGHVVSRTLPLVLIRVLPHVGDTAQSKSKPLADQISAGSLGLAFMWCFMALAGYLYAWQAMQLIAGCVAAVVALAWMWRLFARRLAGFTGDCLGATQQVCELAFYLGFSWGLRWAL